MPTSKRSFDFLKRHASSLLALGLFGVLTFVTLNNLFLNFAKGIPGLESYKDYAIPYWSLWWAKHALIDLHTNPLFTNYILFPNTVNLTLHSHILTLGVLSLPFQYFLDMRLIVNGIIVLSFLLSSSLMFAFLNRHLHNPWLSILGATIYAFSPSTVYRASQIHFSTLPIWWFPLNLLLWDKVIERRSVRWATVLGVSIYLAFMNFSESALWMLLTLPPYMLYSLFTQTTWHARRQVVGLGAVAALAALVPALVMPLPQMQSLDWKEYPREDIRSVQYFSLPIEALFTRVEVGENNTLGQTLPALALVSLAFAGRRRERWLWLSAGLVSLILSFGPYLNDPSQPLPFMLIYNLTRGQYRTPVRLSTPTTLSLVVFVALSLANLFDRLHSRWIQGGLVGVLMVVYVVDAGMLQPFPVRTVPDYPVYRAIGADPEDHTLLQVPIGPASGSRAMGGADQLNYYAHFHHQRTVNGLVSRLPANQLARYSNSAFLRALARENPLPPFEVARAELMRRLASWDIRYIVVHKDLLGESQARPFIQLFNQQPELCVFYDDADTIAYRTIAAWADCPTPHLSALPSGGRLKLGEPDSYRYIGVGWYDLENIGGPDGRWAGETLTSTLHVTLPPVTTRVRLRALAYPRDQVVTVTVNGQSLAAIKLGQDWADYDVVIPASALTEGPSVIMLTHARLESAFDRTNGAVQDKRPLTAAYQFLTFEPVR